MKIKDLLKGVLINRGEQAQYKTFVDLHAIMPVLIFLNAGLPTFQSCQGHPEDSDKNHSRAPYPYIQFESNDVRIINFLETLVQLYNSISTEPHHIKLAKSEMPTIIFGISQHHKESQNLKISRAQLDLYRLSALLSLLDTTPPSDLPKAISTLALSVYANDMGEERANGDFDIVKHMSLGRQAIADLTPLLINQLATLEPLPSPDIFFKTRSNYAAE